MDDGPDEDDKERPSSLSLGRLLQQRDCNWDNHGQNWKMRLILTRVGYDTQSISGRGPYVQRVWTRT